MNCKENEFKCTYPRCISQEYRCDGDDDCGDRSDEDNCENLVGVSCNANEFRYEFIILNRFGFLLFLGKSIKIKIFFNSYKIVIKILDIQNFSLKK